MPALILALIILFVQEEERVQVYGKVHLVNEKTGKEKDAFCIHLKNRTYILDFGKNDLARQLIEAFVCSYDHRAWEQIRVRAVGPIINEKPRTLRVDQFEVIILDKAVHLVSKNEKLMEYAKKVVKFKTE